MPPYVILVILGLLMLSGCSSSPEQTDYADENSIPSGQPEDEEDSDTYDYEVDKVSLYEEEIEVLERSLTQAEEEPLGDKDEGSSLDDILRPEPALMANEHPDNLWERLSQGFRLIQQVDRSLFARQLRFFSRSPNYFNHLSEHARPYLFHIIEEVEARDMPLEIALLPAVESAFRPNLYSPAKAAGLWQFMPATGRALGLKQNRWYDGRKDVVAATEAALDYLQTLHRNLDGDWLNALAAYNCGEGAVRKAIRKNQEQGKPTDFWSLDLPQETRKYVPRLLALATIIASPQRYQAPLLEIENEPYLEEVDIGSQLDLRVAAELSGMSLKEVKRLNPGFEGKITAPKGPHSLLMPRHKVSEFKAKLSRLSKAERLPYKQEISAYRPAQHRYRVKQGDNLWVIAQRFNTSVDTICALNRINRNSQLRSGQLLKVPVNERQASKKAVRAMLKADRNMVSETRLYSVRSGDTLGEIAQRHHTSITKLCKLNGLNPTTILRIGMQLRIPRGN